MRIPFISHLFATLCITLIILVLYFRVYDFDFTYDDLHQVKYNPLVVNDQPPLASLAIPFKSPTLPGDLYRPLTLVSYRLNYLFSGLNPAPYHIVNVALHILCSIAVYYLALGLIPGAHKAALSGALLFAVHPIHVEAVAGVVGRAELLSTLFGCASIAVVSNLDRRSPWFASILSGALLAMAVLSKESALTLLPLIVLYAFLSGKSAARIHALLFLSFSLITSVCLALQIRAGTLGGIFIDTRDHVTFYPENPLLQLDFNARVLPALKILGDYILLLFAPIQLSADYSLGFSDFWSAVFSFSGCLTLVLLGAFALCVLATLRAIWAFWGVWFFVTFSLTANIIVPIGTVMGERLAYLPSVGFCLFISFLVQSLLKNNLVAGSLIGWVLTVSACVALFLRSYTRIPVWSDDLTLFTATMLDAPLSPKAPMNMGRYWYHARKAPQASEPYFRRVLELDPRNVTAGIFLIDISTDRKDYVRAEYWCRKVLEWAPENKKVQRKLAQLLTLKKALEAARGGLGRANN